LAAAAGATLLARAESVWAAPANERIVLAVVGIRTRGNTLAAAFAQRPDCRVAWLCDVDASLLPARSASLGELEKGQPPRCAQDFRKALDDKAVDAVVIATPDHWHCLAGILACQAGKDVYVESPLSHNCWEGRRLVETARRQGRIVQTGHESRSAAYAQSAKKYLADGKLGSIHFCRVLDQKGQSNFPLKPNSRTPKGLDWDMWNGPAPLAPYNVNLHNNWHGWWRYSGGDMAIEGVHQLDLARWLCGLERPRSVCAAGGRFDGRGGNETPEVLTAVYEFDKLVMSFELTLCTPYMLKVSPAVRHGDTFPYWQQCGARIEIYGSEGVMMIGPHGAGWQVFARPRREQPSLVDRAYGQPPDLPHQENFVQCLRSRKPPAADVAEGHLSALLVHYANISYRIGGQKLRIDPGSDEILDNPAAMALFRRTYRKPWVVEG
jgi:predicted dehydrogenase